MEEQHSSKKFYLIAFVVVLLVVITLGFLYVKKGQSVNGGQKSLGALFGNIGNDISRATGNIIKPGNPISGERDTSTEQALEPLFKQLANIQIAGATSVSHDGRTYVRYIARENGYIYDVDVKTAATTQLTNTTIPRIYEAYFANNGNTVIARYLKRDEIARKDTIKTYIANLVLPTSQDAGTLGSLAGSEPQLPDNISALSVSPNGQRLFYLLSVSDGVSGTIVNTQTRIATEVFRNTFSEWLPQLLDNGNVILTSKPSADIAGYAYLYDANKKTLTRIVREKNGMTTLATPMGTKVLYSENLFGNTTLGVYDKKGFVQDEGLIIHNTSLQLATLPEKCAWSGNHIRIYCGAFASTPHAHIPDDWYQGTLSFSDTFWTINTNLANLVLLADPEKEKDAEKKFDVTYPFVDPSEDHFFFVDKNDSTLWSMRLEKPKFTGSEDLPVRDVVVPEFSPEELKDAQGSLPVKPTTTIKSKAK